MINCYTNIATHSNTGIGSGWIGLNENEPDLAIGIDYIVFNLFNNVIYIMTY